MDNKKEYTPEEAARKVLEHVEKLYKSSNLYKANTAHEVEVGSEPMDNGAECPPSLAAEGQASSESSEESSESDMENSEDSEEKKKKKKEDEEEKEYQEEAEEEQDEYEKDGDKIISDVAKDKKPFEKSEKMEKRCWEGYEPTPGKKPYSEGSCRKKTKKSIDQGYAHNMMKSKYSVDEAVNHIMGEKKVNEVMDHMSAEDKKKVLAALRSKDAKKAEMCKGYMMKCGEMEKSEMAKGATFDMTTGQKVGDEASEGYKPAKEKKIPKQFMDRQKKMQADQSGKMAENTRKKIRGAADKVMEDKKAVGKNVEDMKMDLKKKPKNLKEFLKKKKMKKCGDMKMGKNMAPADAQQDKQGKIKQQEAQEPQEGSSKMGY